MLLALLDGALETLTNRPTAEMRLTEISIRACQSPAVRNGKLPTEAPLCPAQQRLTTQWKAVESSLLSVGLRRLWERPYDKRLKRLGMPWSEARANQSVAVAESAAWTWDLSD